MRRADAPAMVQLLPALTRYQTPPFGEAPPGRLGGRPARARPDYY